MKRKLVIIFFIVLCFVGCKKDVKKVEKQNVYSKYEKTLTNQLFTYRKFIKEIDKTNSIEDYKISNEQFMIKIDNQNKEIIAFQNSKNYNENIENYPVKIQNLILEFDKVEQELEFSMKNFEKRLIESYKKNDSSEELSLKQDHRHNDKECTGREHG